jgi:hypothetical protein
MQRQEHTNKCRGRGTELQPSSGRAAAEKVQTSLATEHSPLAMASCDSRAPQSKFHINLEVWRNTNAGRKANAWGFYAKQTNWNTHLESLFSITVA